MVNLIFIMAAMVFFPWLVLRLTKTENWIPLPMFQIATGLVLGPAILGQYYPDLLNQVFTAPVKNALDGIQILAISIFCFIAGTYLKPKEIFEREGSSLFLKGISIVLFPIFLSTLSFYLFFNDPQWFGPDENHWKFFVGMGVATCITALPMLVVSCKSLKIWNTPLSERLLAIVLFDDLVLWIIIPLIITMGASAGPKVLFFAASIALYFIWPKILNKVNEDAYPALIVAFALLMSGVGYAVGLHYVLGAFFAGILTPKEKLKWLEGMELNQMFWLMPVFFIWTGLKTSISIELSSILFYALILLAIDVITKFAGVWIAYRKNGMQLVLFKTSVLQNKGLMQIFLVTVLEKAGIVSPNMFAAVVIMSILSTVIANPLAKLFFKEEYLKGNYELGRSN